MKFGWINGFGGLVVIIMLIPNIIYAVKNQGKENNCKCVVINAIEQIGRYSSMALMCVPLLVWEFGFQSVADMILYFMCDTVLLVAYLIIWRFYFIRPTLKIALCLAILPTLIFLISGVLLRHWLLVVAAVLFGIGHIYISCHSLRHTFTTRMCEAGVNVKVIQDALGHKDVSTTLNIYTDVTKELRKSEFEGLELQFNQ